MCVLPLSSTRTPLIISSVADVFKGKFLESWSLLSTIRKPIIAAVSGYAVSPATSSSVLVLVAHFVPGIFHTDVVLPILSGASGCRPLRTPSRL